MPLILPARTLDSGYEIDNSLRFNSGDTPYLQRSISSGGSGTTATFSAWVKTDREPDTAIFTSYIDSNNMAEIYFSSGVFRIYHSSSGSLVNSLYTNAKYRDISAWYHFVCAFDTTNGTESSRLKIYVNGEQVTSFGTANYPTSSEDMELNSSSSTLNVGARNADESWRGYMAEVYWIDGTALAPTEFGETNDNGVWIPKRFSGSYGTNGFKLEFKNSGALGTDTSGNGNNFTATNLTATDQTTDTPTNNFATLNSLSNFEGSTLSEGNTKAVTPAGSQNGLVPATMGVQNGKWYWEVKVPTTNFVAVGIIADDKLDKDYLTGANSSTRIVKGDDGTKHSSNSSGGNYMASYEGSILQVALNLDDGEITFGAGGSWANGSGSTNQTFSNSTPAYTDLNSSSDFTNKFILPVVSDENQGTSDTFEMNFGNPPFAISSSNSDANGYGNFEYAVPSGYYSLCTKNLAEYG